jgi:antitoxin VapB
MNTRIFRNGNSLAVRLPRELGFGEEQQEVSLELKDGGVFIRPLTRELIGDLTPILNRFPKEFMEDGREKSSQAPRRWK